MSAAAELSRRAFLRGGFLRLVPGGGGPARGPLDVVEGGAVVARVIPSACLAFRGTLCSACHEKCPIPGAIQVDAWRPRVVSGACDGCGLCATVCPAPQRAIAMVAAP